MIKMIIKALLLGNIFLLSANHASGSKKFPEVDQGIGVAQIFDYKMLPGEVENNKKIKFIWGADKPWRNVFTSYYIPYDRDPDKSRDKKWYEKNHPDLIVYKCNKTEPADGFKYHWGTLTPIDINSVSYRNYIYENIILKANNLGFDAIALDNISTLNGWGRCGVYKNGVWIQKFSGEEKDTKFHQEVNQYLIWIKEKIDPLKMKLAINLTYEDKDSNAYIKTSSIADIIVDETGFSRKCKPIFSDEKWERKFLIQQEIAKDKFLVFIDQTCEKAFQVNHLNVRWSLVNYYLLKTPKTYLTVVGEIGDYGGISMASKFLEFNIGKPKSDAKKVGVGYIRYFDYGVVIINPSSKYNLEISLKPEFKYYYYNGDELKNLNITIKKNNSEMLYLLERSMP
jgi:hypothetical protein